MSNKRLERPEDSHKRERERGRTMGEEYMHKNGKAVRGQNERRHTITTCLFDMSRVLLIEIHVRGTNNTQINKTDMKSHANSKTCYTDISRKQENTQNNGTNAVHTHNTHKRKRRCTHAGMNHRYSTNIHKPAAEKCMQRNTDTHTQAHKQTHTQTQAYTEKHTDADTDTHTYLWYLLLHGPPLLLPAPTVPDSKDHSAQGNQHTNTNKPVHNVHITHFAFIPA